MGYRRCKAQLTKLISNFFTIHQLKAMDRTTSLILAAAESKKKNKMR